MLLCFAITIRTRLQLQRALMRVSVLFYLTALIPCELSVTKRLRISIMGNLLKLLLK